MKTTINFIEKVGYGHFKVSILYQGKKEYTAVLTDTQTIDQFRTTPYSEKEKKAVEQARKNLIRQVKRKNNLR